jgi:predicted homoserine dehydrogenase-like protein
VGYDAHPARQQYLNYFKMGDGPLYLFYTPFHLPHLQLPLSVARAFLYKDATVAPLGAPCCDVLSAAKQDLKAGDVLDGIGGFTCYGIIDNADVCCSENLLPMGLSEGCRLKKDVCRDQAITYADVELPEGRIADRLRTEQQALFG